MNNDNSNNDSFEKDLQEINENLKSNENIELTEGLKPENMAKKLETVPQFVPEDNTKKLKKSKKKYIISSLATAAAFVVAITSVMLIKPWEKEPVVKPETPPTENIQQQDYAEIEAMFAEYSENYKKYHNGRFNGGFNLFGSKAEDAVAENAVADSAATNAGSSSNASASSSTNGGYREYKGTGYGTDNEYGETNEQVKGVHEGDIIKNDGKYLYVVNASNTDWEGYYDAFEEHQGDSVVPELKYDCSISIIAPEADGSMDKIFKLNIEKPEDKSIYYMTVSEIYVAGDRLIALADCQKYADYEQFASNYSKHRGDYFCEKEYLTMAVCFDISNRAEPVESWRVYQTGTYSSSRLTGNQLVMISNYNVSLDEDEEILRENCIPKVSCDNAPMKRVDVDCIHIMEDIYNTSYVVVSTLNVEDKETLKTSTVLGAGTNIYCTTETLYATSTQYKYNSGIAEIFGTTSTDTHIYKFDIRNYDVKYVGKGSVKGHALNQFSIDEYNGYLRIATTTGNWGDALTNQLYVLSPDLTVAGEVSGIAPGETIKSVRFMGDTGYVVTFEQTDPLFVIDLSNPKKPEIKGELKIPGFSAYLHPVGDGLLLGVGVDGDENGQNGGLKVSLFDVSDPQNPKECDKITMGGSDSPYVNVNINSEAYNSHKALCWDEKNGTMYIPYHKSIVVISNDAHNYTGSTGILQVTVDKNAKKLMPGKDYVSGIGTSRDDYVEIVRVTYMNNVLFGFSHSGDIVSFDKTTQKQLYKVELS
ncbi:MAG: beta-propeller domain-containing protein [Clostridia bacterium]|nr:beta-propeller domain-containing protein [Clostridia bacterium]